MAAASSAAYGGESKHWRRLAPFFKEREKASTRLKAVHAFLSDLGLSTTTQQSTSIASTSVGSVGSNNTLQGAEQDRLFRQHGDSLFPVVLQRLGELEGKSHKNKHHKSSGDKDKNKIVGKIVTYGSSGSEKSVAKELHAILLLVKKLLEHNASRIRQEQWRFKDFESVIARTLAKKNPASVRLVGFDLLLLFVEALQDSLQEAQRVQFATAINLEVFVTTATGKVTFRHGSASSASGPSSGNAENNAGGGAISASSDGSVGAAGGQSMHQQLLDAEELILSAEPCTTADSLELIKFFLDFIALRPGTFHFWWNMFRDHYLATFFPALFQELRVLDKYDESGFRRGAPAPVLSVLCDYLSRWGDKQDIFTMAWEPEVGGPLMMEIHRQCMQLPLENTITIQQAFHTWHKWLVTGQRPRVFLEDAEKGTGRPGPTLQRYWQVLLKNVSLIFGLTSDRSQLDTHHVLCLDVLQSFNHFVSVLAPELARETWELLQYTLLSTAYDLLNRTQPNASNYCATTFDLINKMSSVSRSRARAATRAVLSAAPGAVAPDNSGASRVDPQDDVQQSLGDHMFGTLYYAWIVAPGTTTEMWKDVSKQVQALTQWKANVTQWKEKLLQLTLVLIDMLYSGDESDELAQPVRKESRVPPAVFLQLPGQVPSRGVFTTEDKSSSSSDYTGGVVARRDQRFSVQAMGWKIDQLREMWLTFLCVLGNVTKIADPVSHETAMAAVSSVVKLLVDAEERLPFGAPRPISITKVFLPWLIEGCHYDERLLGGVIVSYRTLCSLFCRRQFVVAAGAAGEANALLSHFYRIIQLGLNNVKSEIIWEIIDNCTTIFAYDLNGAAVLIPDFLREIEIMCSPRHSRDVKAHYKLNALSIVNSLLCVPNHYAELGFPVLEAGNHSTPAASAAAAAGVGFGAFATPQSSAKQNSDDKPSSVMPAGEMKTRLAKILLAVLSNVQEDLPSVMSAICGASVFVSEELTFATTSGRQGKPPIHNSVPSNPLNMTADELTTLARLISSILEFLEHHDLDFLQFVCDTLSDLAQLYGGLIYVPSLQQNQGSGFDAEGKPSRSVVIDIIARLCKAIRSRLALGVDGEKAVAALLLTLREWFLINPRLSANMDMRNPSSRPAFEDATNMLLAQPHLAVEVLSCLETCVFGQIAQPPRSQSSTYFPGRVFAPEADQLLKALVDIGETAARLASQTSDTSGKDAAIAEQVLAKAGARDFAFVNPVNPVISGPIVPELPPKKKHVDAESAGLPSDGTDQSVPRQDTDEASFDSRGSVTGGAVAGSGKKKNMGDVLHRLREIQKRIADPYIELCNKPSHGSKLVHDTARVVLQQILRSYNGFPPASGVEVVDFTAPTTINEQAVHGDPLAQARDSSDMQPQNSVFFLLNKRSIVSLTEFVEQGENVANHRRLVRLVIRDRTGAFSWDCVPSAGETESPVVVLDKQQHYYATDDQINSLVAEMLKWKSTPCIFPEGPPSFEQQPKPNTDMCAWLLSWLSKEHPDETAKEAWVPTPSVLTGSTGERLRPLLEPAQKALDLFQQHCAMSTADSSLGLDAPMVDVQLETTPEARSESPFLTCRLLLLHLGLLSTLTRESLVQLEGGDQFTARLREVDKIRSREVFKVGLLFVAPDQEKQAPILANDRTVTSRLYNDFVDGLGWPVSLATHRGYAGGLDTTTVAINGQSAPYWASTTEELIWHEVAGMPTKIGDNQQLEKKKHVGNDSVHVVWSEHGRDYQPYTITSHFNDAHVVVYPLPNGLFRIQTFRKNSLFVFGPLTNDMVIPKRLLASLVRRTAINASRRSRPLIRPEDGENGKALRFMHPFRSREMLIRTSIAEKFTRPAVPQASAGNSHFGTAHSVDLGMMFDGVAPHLPQTAGVSRPNVVRSETAPVTMVPERTAPAPPQKPEHQRSHLVNDRAQSENPSVQQQHPQAPAAASYSHSPPKMPEARPVSGVGQRPDVPGHDNYDHMPPSPHGSMRHDAMQAASADARAATARNCPVCNLRFPATWTEIQHSAHVDKCLTAKEEVTLDDLDALLEKSESSSAAGSAPYALSPSVQRSAASHQQPQQQASTPAGPPPAQRAQWTPGRRGFARGYVPRRSFSSFGAADTATAPSGAAPSLPNRAFGHVPAGDSSTAGQHRPAARTFAGGSAAGASGATQPQVPPQRGFRGFTPRGRPPAASATVVAPKTSTSGGPSPQSSYQQLPPRTSGATDGGSSFPSGSVTSSPASTVIGSPAVPPARRSGLFSRGGFLSANRGRGGAQLP